MARLRLPQRWWNSVVRVAYHSRPRARASHAAVTHADSER
jgi:hypothetical protein